MDKIIPFEKSFASSGKEQYWSKKNTINPENVSLSSGKKFWFDCNNCHHTFESMLSNIKKGQWCSYCSNPPKKLCDDECKLCFDKSFANHPRSIFWSKKNKLNPRDVFKSTSDKYWFKCVNKHVFDQSLSAITQGKWCRYCVNKTEHKLYDELCTYYPLLTQQFKVEWCKNKNHLPYDFVLDDFKLIIELDGLQHFEQVSN